MDWWLTWHMLQGVVAFGVMVLTAASILVAWRLRGILHWKRSLSDELKGLDKEAEAAGERKEQALTVVRERCQRVWHATSPELKELADISVYVHSIAACYYPGLEKPELRITIGRFLKSAHDSVDRLELILRRPGFQRLRGVRIRHIRHSYEWYDRVSQYRIVRWVRRYRKLVTRIFRLRLVLLPDPFSWLAYLSNRLTMLTLTRCLLVDVYLFVGRLAIQAYNEEGKEEPIPSELGELQKTLEDLDSLEPSAPHVTDTQIMEIRNRLVGFPSMLISSPGLEDWKQAVGHAANVIAGKYFPDAERPLEEAALGPLLTRSQIWIKSLCKTERIPVVKQFHRIQIQSLYRVRSLTDMWLPKQVRIFAKKTWDMYRWMKWPLMVYRGVKRYSSVGIAMDVGWVVSKRAFTNFICRYTFDMACQELEMIYSQSRAKQAGRF
ncbi:MAG: hypothetical protein DRG87_07925 [Deltaproteobacteria bacterium]|nr:hypothetical protein [Deltaproteobacteria bacterium]RLB29081.1 MAG: hypothetical protein DRG87_07925 [Deltaproteobacteria bacterium]